MCPVRSALLTTVLLTGSVCAQSFDEQTAAYAEDDAVDQYLDALGLDRLRAVHLEQRLGQLSGEARRLAAVRLATLYGMLLEQDRDPMFRRDIEARSRELLRLVPPEDAAELRLTIVKARYFQAELRSQASLLGGTKPEEDAALAREFIDLLPDLTDLARQAQRRVEEIKRRLRDRNANIDEAALRAELDQEQSRASQARYYLGWSQVELARLTGQRRYADGAVEALGSLLGADGSREPSVEAVSPGLLTYSHVARAALGCARAYALRGDDVNAVRWLDLVIDADDSLTDDVQQQLLAHRILVLSQARRWADLQAAVEEATRDEGSSLRPLEARLLAVATLDAMSEPMSGPVGDARRTLLEGLAQVGLTQLVEQERLAEVLAIVTRFGTLPIGQRGFIVHYVRAMRAIERAELAQGAAEEGLGSPSGLESVINRYLEAADLFELAVKSDDAERFGVERGDAAVLWGRSLFAAGQFERAAEVFSVASELRGVGASIQEEAAWNQIVALDRAVAGGKASLQSRRDEAAASYLDRFAASDRAPELLIRQAEGGLLPRSEAIEILLAVDEASPLWRSSRLMGLRLLFDAYREAARPLRAQLADRFVGIAGATRMRLDADGDGAARRRLTRQMLDAAFATKPPSIAAARQLLDDLAGEGSSVGEELAGEVAYRRLQLAIAEGDRSAADARHAELIEIGGAYLGYAQSLLYDRAASAFRADRSNIDAARDTMVLGQRLLGDLLLQSPARIRQAVAAEVVLAAAAVHAAAASQDGDPVARDLAIALAERLMDEEAAPLEVLMAHARLANARGDTGDALESWRLVLSSLDAGGDAWIDARLESLRVLVRVDASRAQRVLGQFNALYADTLSPAQAARHREVEALVRRFGEGETAEPDTGGAAGGAG